MNRENIGIEVDSWIDEDEIPVTAFLKPIRKYEDLMPKDEIEREAYLDFMRWFFEKEHQVLLDIPIQEKDFWKKQIDEFGNDISAFNTVDYKRLYPFNKYGYRLKKIFARAKDLAETYSCLSNEDGKRNIHQRFLDLIDKEFRDYGRFLLKTYNKYPELINKVKLFDKIQEINENIKRCKDIWEKHKR